MKNISRNTVMWSMWICFALVTGWVAQSVSLRRRTNLAILELARKEREAQEARVRAEQEAEEARRRAEMEKARQKAEEAERANKRVEVVQERRESWWSWGRIIGVLVVLVLAFVGWWFWSGLDQSWGSPSEFPLLDFQGKPDYECGPIPEDSNMRCLFFISDGNEDLKLRKIHGVWGPSELEFMKEIRNKDSFTERIAGPRRSNPDLHTWLTQLHLTTLPQVKSDTILLKFWQELSNRPA